MKRARPAGREFGRDLGSQPVFPNQMLSVEWLTKSDSVKQEKNGKNHQKTFYRIVFQQ
jgi:hypothetical protein